METTTSKQEDSNIKLNIVVDEKMLASAKKAALAAYRPQVKAAGFREGKAPDKVVEKSIGDEKLQQEAIDRAISVAYTQAIEDEKLRVLSRPEVSVTKFVPYSELEFEATVEVMPEFKLPDYKKIKVSFEEPEVTKEDIDKVLENLQQRVATSKQVKRAAKEGDKVWIDFKGVRADDGSEVAGASGEDYPLLLGSDTFIKGFEPELIGVTGDQEKSFTVTFPKDYNVKALQNQKVTFSVQVKKVEEVTKPKLDDAFAKQVGSFDDLKSLKADVKGQLLQEKLERARSDHRQQVIEKVIDKTKVTPPAGLLERVRKELEQELEQNLQYRGMAIEQYAQQQGYDSVEEFGKQELDPQSVKRAKSSLIMTEIAEAEQLTVQREELDARLETLKEQYPDEKMQAQLDTPDARRELAAQMLTEKTLAKLVEYAS